MRRPSPMRQQGFGLLSFVLLAAVVAFTLVVGFAGVMTRREANELPAKQQAYLLQAAAQVKNSWRANAYSLDSPGAGATATAEDVLRMAKVQPRYGMAVELSNVQTIAAEKLSYRTVVLYLPAESDETNPPDLAKFRATGVFSSCTSTGLECSARVYQVFSSLEVERDLAKETQLRLAKLAQKAQSYFKARMLQDPERNVSVNYFRKPSGACEVGPLDLGCMDTYQPLAALDSLTGYSTSKMANSLGLTDEELFSAWGLPLEASNLQDSVVDDAPYTMVFRAARPAGGFYSVIAVQQF